MSQKRQSVFSDPQPNGRAPLSTLSYDYPPQYEVPLHYHNVDQLVYASRGVMTVHSEDGMWVVPPHRAVWIPAKVPHSISMSGAVAMRTLYLRPKISKHLPRACCVVSVSPLLRELVLHACALRKLSDRVARHRHLMAIILDELETLPTVSLQLPNPSDQRAMKIVAMLIKDPGPRRSIHSLCKMAGLSKRTLERIFQQEVGMSFGRWRQQLRLMHAMRLLAEGAKVTYVAMEAGYSTPSSFIAMFRKALGTTPSAYFREPHRVA